MDGKPDRKHLWAWVFRIAAILLGLCFGTAAWSGPTFQWGDISPFAVYWEDVGSSTITLRARITGQPYSVVATYFGNWFSGGSEPFMTVPMYDDGTRGDLVAGDGIYTAQFVFGGEVPRLRKNGGQLDHLQINVNARDVNGNYVPFDNAVNTDLYLGLVGKRNRIVPVQLNSQVMAADAAINIVDANFYADVAFTRPMQTFYRSFPDDLDGFVMFNGGRSLGSGNPGGFIIKNTVTGTGMALSDNSSAYGSAGKLKYGVWANKNVNADEFLHEFGHSFGIYLSQPQLNLTANGGLSMHWGTSDVIGQMRGGSYLKANPDGSFMVTNVDPTTTAYAQNRYADLELYLMGLLPASQVAPHYFALGTPGPAWGTTIDASAVTRVSIDNIVSAYGARVPAASTSQKQFKIAFVVVTDRFVSVPELSYINTVSRYYASGMAGGTLVPGGLFPLPDPPSFASATNHLATLTTSVQELDQPTQERILDWAQARYAQYFSPAASTQVVAGYRARAYPGGIYLGILHDRVYVYGPPWGAAIRDVGSALDYLTLAVQDGF
jgi:hypothetical protein